jgi:ketosteroid isomerase-like protein
MSVKATQGVLNRYFEEMETGDIARLLADDVTWTITDTGTVVRGQLAVRDHITALHQLMLDTHTSELVVADGTAYLEGDCLTAPDAPSRTAFCLVYDVKAEHITAMRVYGPVESELCSTRVTVHDATRADS